MKFLKRLKSERKQAAAQARIEQSERLDALTRLAEESRSVLDNAALQTCEIAEDLTLRLRADLIDHMRQIELTASIMADALVVSCEDGRVLFMNHVAETLLQCSISPDHELNFKDHVFSTAENFWGTFDDPSLPVKIIRGDGVEIAVQGSVARLDRSDGTVNFIVLLHTGDVTENPSDAQFQDKGTILVRDGMITATNTEAETTLGYAPGTLLNMPLATIIAPKEQEFVDKQISNHSVETSFDTSLLTQSGSQLHCKMAITFVRIGSAVEAIVSLDNIGPDIMDRKVDVMRCFGEDFFFRSSTYITEENDMVMYLTPDFVIKYVNEPMRLRLVGDDRNLVGTRLEEVLTATEYKIATLHFQGLTKKDCERSISIHLKNTNAGAHQHWTDRAYFNGSEEVVEYRRKGGFSN